MKLKHILTILFFTCIIASCAQPKNKKNELQEKSSHKMTEEKTSQQISSQKYKTATGKSIEILIESSSNSLNNIAIVPLDFQHSIDTFKINDADPLTNTWLLDLDKNGYEELFLITSSVGSGSYQTIYGYASNQDSSITPIYVPSISENDVMKDGIFYGYMGHDSIYVDQRILYRKFPIFQGGDANCCPTGGEKILRYGLRAGEASWILEVQKE